MSIDPLQQEPEDRSVRIELFDDNTSHSHEVGVPSRSDRTQSRGPALAMILASIALVGGLWWAAGFESSETSESARPALVDPVEGDGVPDAPGPPESVATDDAAVPTSVVSWTPLDTELSHVVRGPSGVLAGGDWANDGSGREPQRPVLTQPSTVNEWTFSTPQNIPPGARIVGLSRLDDVVLVFASTTNDADRGGSELTIYSSDGDPGGLWEERSRFGVPGHVRSLSTRDGRWVATIDPRAQATTTAQPMRTTVISGTVDGSEFDTTSVAPDEFISSFAAIEDGFVAIVVRVQLQAVNEDAQPPQLRQWTPDDGWSELDDTNVFTPTTAAARLIDSGENGLHIAFGYRLYRGSGFPLEWELVATGRAVADGLDDPFAPEITPARVGPGYLIVDTVLGDVRTIWISADGSLWRQHTIDIPLQRPELLQVVDDVALVSGVSESTPGVLRIDLGEPETSVEGAFALDVRERTVEDGEWTTPVFSAAQTDGSGFVGLANTNGEIVLLQSSDGFNVDRRTPTNFPFGYFVNDMQTTSAGYSVVGQLGLLEDAVFLSTDGADWERFPIELPGDATALQIDHFHRTAQATAMVGSLGWADDFSRTERVVLWWDAEDTAHVVPARPCGGGTYACSITGITVLEVGLIATHGSDGGAAISRWTPFDDWQTFSALDPAPLADGNLFITSDDAAWFLATERMASSADGGETWTFGVQAPPGAAGRFIAVSASGAASVFETATELWFRSGGVWTPYELGEMVVGKVLAITEDVALLSGTLPTGPVVIRLVAGTG